MAEPPAVTVMSRPLVHGSLSRRCRPQGQKHQVHPPRRHPPGDGHGGVLGQARLDDEIWYKLFRMRDL